MSTAKINAQEVRRRVRQSEVDKAAAEATHVSVAAAAARLSVHDSTVRRWLAEGLLRGTRIGLRLWRVEVASIDELLGTGAEETPPEAA